MSETLFTYGTLNLQKPPAEIEDVLASFVALGSASVRGRLYQLQEYPGLVLDPAADPVHGQLFEVPEGAWERLDAYEGYDPAVPESSLFLRVKTAATVSDGRFEDAWIYVYNRHTAE